MEKILTVIIAAYNMENFLKRCCSSLIIPDNFNRLEVLIINDGSKDKTLEIAYKFAQKYKNVFRVIDKQNGNYGSCINRGLLEARGVFVKTLDADDIYKTECLNELVKFLIDLEENETNKVDLVITDTYTVDLKGQVKSITRYPFPQNKVCDAKDLEYTKLLDFSLTSATYRLNKLNEMKYKQTEGISYTDQEFIRIPLLSVEHFIYFPVSVYMYTVGRSGQTMEYSRFMKNFSMHFPIMKNIICFYEKEKGKYPIENQECLRKLIVNVNLRYIYYMYLMRNRKKLNMVDIIEFDNYLSKYFPDVYDDMDNVIITPKIPIKFIRIWRSKYGNNWKYKSLYLIYIVALNVHLLLKRYRV